MRRIVRPNACPSLVGLLACAGVGLALRTQELSTISYWFDESFTWKMIDYGALELCVLLVLTLIWRRRAFEAYLALAAVVPAALVLLAQTRGANIWDTHYFLAVHLFWVVALAVMASGIPRPGLRRSVSAALVVIFLALDARHWQLRDAQAHRPGAIAAMAWLDSARRAREPVIVCSPMLHTTVAAHSRHREEMYVFRWPFEYVHFHGTAVFEPADFFDARRLQSLRRKWLWAVDTDGWSKGTWTVPVPPCWKLQGQRSFTAIEGEDYQMIIRLYRREGGDEAKMRLASGRW